MSVMTGSLPRRYARALLQLAEEKGKSLVSQFDQELGSFSAPFATSEEGRQALQTLANPLLSHSQRKKAVENLADQAGLHPILKNFLLLLMDKERIALLPEIVREYKNLSHEFLGLLRVIVKTPQKPDEGLLKKINGLLAAAWKKQGGEEVIARGEAHPEMIGGILIELEEKHIVYDGSVKRELERMRDLLRR